MTYLVQRKDRFYVAYDGLDPLTGRRSVLASRRRDWCDDGEPD